MKLIVMKFEGGNFIKIPAKGQNRGKQMHAKIALTLNCCPVETDCTKSFALFSKNNANTGEDFFSIY